MPWNTLLRLYGPLEPFSTKTWRPGERRERAASEGYRQGRHVALADRHECTRASLQGQTLTLTGVSPDSIVFADRPVRAAGHLLTAHLLEEWSDGSFAKDYPNATVSVLSKAAIRSMMPSSS